MKLKKEYYNLNHLVKIQVIDKELAPYIWWFNEQKEIKIFNLITLQKHMAAGFYKYFGYLTSESKINDVNSKNLIKINDSVYTKPRVMLYYTNVTEVYYFDTHKEALEYAYNLSEASQKAQWLTIKLK